MDRRRAENELRCYGKIQQIQNLKYMAGKPMFTVYISRFKDAYETDLNLQKSQLIPKRGKNGVKLKTTRYSFTSKTKIDSFLCVCKDHF